MITTRRAMIWDATALTVLWERLHTEAITRTSMRKEYANAKNIFLILIFRLESPDWDIFVAEDDGVIIGFIMGNIHYPTYNPCHLVATGDAFYIEPKYRGQGIHKKLFDNMLQCAAEKGVEEIEFLGCYTPRMIKFYDSMGYVPVQVIYRKKEKEENEKSKS